MLRSIYNWCLKQAEGRHAEKVLFGVAFAESSVFPLPPDILLLPMALAQRLRAYRFALVCTLGSVLGGLLGYAIGALLMATVGQWIIETYHLQAAFQRFHEEFQKWGVLIILAKGLTPIPFKLVTIASGAAALNLPAFIAASLLTRGFRFFMVAFLVRRYGEPIRNFIEKYLTWVALGVLALIVLGFWVVLRQ
jgi:membrane protein YqaA with SNARE-associated domain